MKNRIALLIWIILWSILAGFRVGLHVAGKSTLIGLIISIPMLAYGIYKFLKDEE